MTNVPPLMVLKGSAAEPVPGGKEEKNTKKQQPFSSLSRGYTTASLPLPLFSSDFIPTAAARRVPSPLPKIAFLAP